MKVLCEVSLGELVDKISILIIKKKFIVDAQKLALVSAEESVLSQTLAQLKLEGINSLLERLIEVNSTLWKIEDDIRLKEKAKIFDAEFIELARSVYRINDARFALKNEINEKYGSFLQEVKSYEKYD